MAQSEYARQMNRMEHKQKNELLYIEQIQREQFAEFTEAWDSYMSEYEMQAAEGIEKLKSEHYQ